MIGVKFVGDVMAPSGYGNALRDLARVFEDLGVPFFFQHIQHDRNAAKLDDYWRDRLPGYLKPRPYCTIINSTTPEYYQIEEGKTNIGWTFWETDRLPDWDHKGLAINNWVKQINRLTQFWAPSGFVKRIAQESGVTVSCHVVPWPCADKFLEVKPKLFEHQYIKPTDFVIGSVGQFTERKNFKDFVLAFCSEFKAEEPVVGVIKAYGANDSSEQVNLVRQTISNWKSVMNVVDCARLVGLHSLMEEEDMLSLYQRIDLYANLSRGEGMGGPCIHAMALGKPVISTAFSAMEDYIDYDTAFMELNYTLEPVNGMPHIPWYGRGQQWARLDVGQIRQGMRSAFETWKINKDDYNKFGERAAAKVRSLYTRDAVATQIKAALGV